MKKFDFAIVGAGINGLLVARELAMSGAEVCLVDKGVFGAEASWAGGGIISPLYPWRYSSAVTALATWAQAFYPQLVEELKAQTGIDSQLLETGLLMLDADDAELAQSWARREQQPMDLMAAQEIYEHEPSLCAGFDQALWMSNVKNIRNPRLIKALRKLLENYANVTVMEHSEVVKLNHSFKKNSSRTVNSAIVHSNNEKLELRFDQLVLCSGAWTKALSCQVGVELEVQPVKGQMLLYKLNQPVVSSIVLTSGRYLIPRRDNYLLVGSTLEYTDFNKATTDAAKVSLAQSACSMVACLESLEPVAQWAGLRPQAPHGVPYIGKLPTLENVHVNAGQYRNGLVLAPASARLLADLLLHRPVTIDPEPYNPETRLLAEKRRNS